MANDLAYGSHNDSTWRILVLVFLRVDVYSEAQPWYRIIQADLFVLALIASSLFGLIWSFLQSLNLSDRWDDKVFLVFYIVSNLVLFGGIYWSKFAHMFYKPGAAIQKNLAEAVSYTHLTLPTICSV